MIFRWLELWFFLSRSSISRHNLSVISPIWEFSEECFQKTPLEFIGTEREVRPEFNATWTTEPVFQSNVGTWPKGSTWRKNHYFPPTNDPPPGMMQKVKYIGRGQIKDKVKVPDVEAGTYVVSWRWDCEASPQVWSGCANVELVDWVVL